MSTPLTRTLSAILLFSAAALAAPPPLDVHGDPLPNGAIARLGSVRLRHGDPVNFVVFLPGSKTLLSASFETIRVWDATTGKEICRFSHHGESEARKDPFSRLGASLSADGKVLATSIFSRTEVVLSDVPVGKILKRFQVGFSVEALAISPDGRFTAVGCNKSGVHLFDREGKKVRTLPYEPTKVRFTGNSMGLTFAPDGKTVAVSGTEESGGAERTILCWETASGRLLYRTVIGVNSFVGTPPAFSPAGKMIAASTRDSGIVLLDAVTGKERSAIKAKVGNLNELLFTANGKVLIALNEQEDTIRVWEAATAKELNRILVPTDPQKVHWRPSSLFQGSGGMMSLSADGKILAAADGSRIRLIGLPTGKELNPLVGHRGEITDTVFQAGTQTILTLGSDGSRNLWEAATGKHTGHLKVPANTWYYAHSSDGKRMAIERNDGVTKLVGDAAGKELCRLDYKERILRASYAFSPDGKLLARRHQQDSAVYLFSVETGKLLVTLGEPTDRINRELSRIPRSVALAFSPDGKTLAAPDDGWGMNLWDVPSATKRRSIPSPLGVQVRCAAFSPDGRKLALDMNDNTIVEYELASGLIRANYPRRSEEQANPLTRRPPPGMSISNVAPGFRTLCYSPDGRRIAAAAENHMVRAVRIWDVLTGEEVGHLKGHQGEVFSVVFAPDGKTLATASEDATALIWDMNVLKGKQSLPTKLDESAVRHYWNDLLTADGAKAFAAIVALAAAPADTVPFMKRELKPAKPADPERIRQLIAKLESEKFAERKQAMRELTALGNLALDALEKTLASKPALEVSKRAEEIVTRIRSRVLADEELRLVRAIEVLELTGNPEARGVLRELANGAATALVTTEARAALQRLR